MIKREATIKISAGEIEEHNLLKPLLDSLLGEVRSFSSKKQDTVLNKLKVANINRILSRIKDLVAADPVSFFLELLDEDTLPTNSDAVLVLVQFQTALIQFRDKRQTRDIIGSGSWALEREAREEKSNEYSDDDDDEDE